MSERASSEEANSNSEEANNADSNEHSMDSGPGTCDTRLSDETLTFEQHTFMYVY